MKPHGIAPLAAQHLAVAPQPDRKLDGVDAERRHEHPAVGERVDKPAGSDQQPAVTMMRSYGPAGGAAPSPVTTSTEP